jgi:hypothetical protein
MPPDAEAAMNNYMNNYMNNRRRMVPAGACRRFANRDPA